MNVFCIIFASLCISALFVASGIDTMIKDDIIKGFYKFLGAGIVISIGLMILLTMETSAADWIVTGSIFGAIISVYTIFIGIAFIKGLTMREALCAMFKIEPKKPSSHILSEKTRKKVGIATISSFVALLIVCICLLFVFFRPGKSDTNRKCDYCGKEGASFSVGTGKYCSTCYDAFEITKDRLEDN